MANEAAATDRRGGNGAEDAPSAAFSFVQHITDFIPGRRARGRLLLANDLILPPCLAAEAVGQLAAWAAMAACDFVRRPVAGIAGEVVFAPHAATSVVELEVELETCDDDAVAYRGRATSAGAEVVSLRDCVGPMLPTEDFDDPQALRDRCRRLRTAAESPLSVVPDPFASCAVREIDRDPGERIEAELVVPATASFFADHFPRKPVFPATLFLDAQIRLALDLLADAVTARRRTCVYDVKMRSFISPSDVVAITAERIGGEIRLTGRGDGRRLSTAAVLIESEPA